MHSDSELLTAVDGGIQTIVPLAASAQPQIVYLDFDGATASYRNAELGVAIDNVTVEDSGFDSAAISVIVDALNGQFGDDVVFTSELPSEGVFSTIYVGVTSAFDEYGSFYGLAETIDSGNQIHDDNAFVLLDSSAPAELVVSVIAHETEHIVHGMDHGGDGLERYAVINVTGGVPSVNIVVNNDMMNVYIGGLAMLTTVNGGGVMHVYNGGQAINTTVNQGGSMEVYNTGQANGTTVNQGGSMAVYSAGMAFNTTVNAAGAMSVYSGGTANITTIDFAQMLVLIGGTVNGTIIINGGMMGMGGGTANGTTISGGRMDVYNYAIATSTTLNGAMLYNHYEKGELHVESHGTATYTTVNDGGNLQVCSGGTANITSVNGGGEMYVSKGGVATSTTVRDGWMYVSSGGTATNTTVNNSGLIMVSDATANGTTVNSGGLLVIINGMHSGSLQIADDEGVVAESGATIDFTVAAQKDRNIPIVNHYDYIDFIGPHTFTITVSGEEADGRYALAGNASTFNSTVTVKTTSGAALGTLTVGGSFTSDKTIYSLAIYNQTLFLDAYNALLTNVKSQTNGNGAVIDWSGDGTMVWSHDYDARLSNGAGVVAMDGLAASGLELLNLPAGDMAVSVKPVKSDVWTALDALKIPDISDAAAVSGVGNGMAEVMFARGTSVWGGQYVARHVGGGWSGARPEVALAGRNVLEDIFIGSEDATLLLLTDDANGDAVFLEDVCSAFPDGVGVSARVAKIDEIRAGAGDDVVDLTSQRFSHVGDGMTVRGGLGDDVIWAAGGNSMLFGDAGDDWIVGSAGNDIIVGGIGDDRLHGGGGSDIFCFCADWGHDTVEQFASGAVTLWFAEGDESKWDNSSLTYADGDNSVTVTGVDSVTLLFGNADGRHASLLAAGAFDAFTSERIFEERGMLA